MVTLQNNQFFNMIINGKKKLFRVFIMKIKDVKVLLVEGGPTPPEGLFEENPPINGFGGRIAEEPNNMMQPYVKIITDEEITGLSPGFPSRVAPFIIRDLLKPVLIGHA